MKKYIIFLWPIYSYKRVNISWKVQIVSTRIQACIVRRKMLSLLEWVSKPTICVWGVWGVWWYVFVGVGVYVCVVVCCLLFCFNFVLFLSSFFVLFCFCLFVGVFVCLFFVLFLFCCVLFFTVFWGVVILFTVWGKYRNNWKSGLEYRNRFLNNRVKKEREINP